MLRLLTAKACPAALQAAHAAGTPGLAVPAGRLLSSSAPAAAVERPPHQTDSAEGAQEPFVEGDTLAAKRTIRQSYEDILKEKSGTAEDVRVVDQGQSSLGKMTKDPQAVEGEYAQAARDSVVSHGGSERFSEDEGIADAVFDQTRSDKGYDESPSNKTQPWDSTYATKPK